MAIFKNAIMSAEEQLMNSLKRLGAIRLVSFVLAALVLSGCAVLTEKQINAVNQFAKATEYYGPVPSNAIKTWAELQLAASAAEVSSMQNEQVMWNHIETSFDTYQKILDRSERAIRSFEIFDSYSKLLLQLTSDNYVDALNAETQNLGKSLDSSISYYNSRFGASLSCFGGDAAGILRAGLGLYLRVKQAEVLRKIVEDADPVIGELVKAVVETLEAVELGVEKETDTLEREIRTMLKFAPVIKSEPSDRKIIPDLASYLQAFQLIQRGRSASQLVSSAKSAAVQYGKTHHDLLENTRNKTDDVQSLFPKIAALKAEVDAGIKLRKSLMN
jgi:hypothetical protein